MKEIQLTKGYTTQVSDEDYDNLSRFKWYAWVTDGKVRAARKPSDKTIIMSRFIMGAEDPKILVDHKDGNTLNNQRSNLRLCSTAENTRNHTGLKLKGFTKRPSGRYRASIHVGGNHIALGTFDSEYGAAKAYNEAAIKYFGEYAGLNDLSLASKSKTEELEDMVTVLQSQLKKVEAERDELIAKLYRIDEGTSLDFETWKQTYL